MATRLTRRLASGYRAAGTKGYDGKMVVGQPNIYAKRPRGAGAGLGNSVVVTGPRQLAATATGTFVAPGTPLTPEWDARTAIEKYYLGHAYVMRCIRLRAETVAGLPFCAGPDPADPSRTIPHSPLVNFLGAATPGAPGGPNDQTTARAFWIWTICQYIATGKFAWEYERANANAPIEGLWCVPSAYVDPVPAAEGTAAYWDSYVIHARTRDISRPLWKMLYHWRMSANDPRQPESALQSARMPVQVAIASDKYMWGLISQGMMGAKMVISNDFEEAGARRAFEDQFNAAYTGYDNAGKVLFAYADNDYDAKTGNLVDRANLQVIDLSMSAVDAQLAPQVAQAKSDIEVALGVPESIIGNASGRIFANASEEIQTFWNTTVVNDIAELQDAVNLRLAPDLAPGTAGWFDLSRVVALQPSSIFQPPAITDAINAGIVTAQQAADLLGIPAIDAKGEDVQTAPIDEEPAAAASSAGTPSGGGGRAIAYSVQHRLRYRAKLERASEGLRALSELSLPDGWAYKYRSLNTTTYKYGTAGWGIVRVERPRITATSSGVRSRSHMAPTPALAQDVTARAAQMRRHRLGVRSTERIAALEAEVDQLRSAANAPKPVEPDPFSDFDAWFEQASPALAALVEAGP